MPENVLKGIINITAPGAQAAFTAVQGGAKKTEAALVDLGTKVKLSADNLTVLGRVSQRSGSNLGGLSGVLRSTSISLQQIEPATSAAKTGFANLAKQLVASQLGMIGIGSALIFLGKSLFDAVTGANRLASATKLLADAQHKAAEASGDEVVQLQTLYTIAKDVSVSYEKRMSAIAELNKLYPELNNNLTIENINTLKVADAINKVSRSLIVQAEIKELTKTIASLNLYSKDIEKTLLSVGGALQGPLSRELRDAKNRVQSLTESLIELQKEGLKPVLGAVGVQGGALGGKAKLDKEKDIKVPKLKIKPEKVEISLDQFLKGNITGIAEADIKLIPPKEAEQQGVDGAALYMQGFEKEIKKYFDTPFVTDFDLIDTVKISEKLKTQLEDVNNQLSSIIQGVAADLASQFGEAFGTALGGGNLRGIFDNFVNILANGFSAIGRQLIAASPIIAALKVALKTLNPVAMLAAGIGLVAIGGLLRSSLSKGIQARASGGPVLAGRPYMVGERGPELMIPNTGGNIVANSQLGGGFSGGGVRVHITGQFTQRGTDMVATIDLVRQSNLRLR